MARAVVHSAQEKRPALCSPTVSAKACACQGSANTGPSTSFGKCGSSANRARSPDKFSDRLKVVFPQIHMDGIVRIRRVTPKFASGEAHCVKVTCILAQASSI